MLFLLQELNKFEKEFLDYMLKMNMKKKYKEKVIPNIKKIFDCFENDELGKIVSIETF
ncbi:MAG: hypothetical protein L6U99_05935 [Clostridium sp.]|nr:MAG: hypothetical protein L6U99_05935 [Clostridium sp.]